MSDAPLQQRPDEQTPPPVVRAPAPAAAASSSAAEAEPAWVASVTRGTAVAAPLRPLAGSAAVAGPISETSAAAALQNSAATAATTSAPPQLLAVPSFLGALAFHLILAPEKLQWTLRGALAEAGVTDVAWDPAVWALKAHVYRPRGSADFTLRAYSAGVRAGDVAGPRIAVDVTRDRGSHGIAQAAVERALIALQPLLEPGTPGAERAATLARMQAAREEAAECAAVTADFEALGFSSGGSTAGSSNSGSSPALPPAPPALCAAADLLAGVPDALDTPAAASTAASSPTAMAAVSDAFVPLLHGLRSAFDDVATPAAETVATLCDQLQVRVALGTTAAEALRQREAAKAAGGAGGAPLPPLPASLLVLDALLKRALGLPLAGAAPASSSVPCRTAAAIGLAGLSRFTSVAEVLLALRFHVGCLHVVASTLAPAADVGVWALRRELLRTLRNVLSPAFSAVPAVTAAARELRAMPEYTALASFLAGPPEAVAAAVGDAGAVELARSVVDNVGRLLAPSA